jgi:CheY-like chemotaxis protein
LRHLLKSYDDVQVIGEAGDGKQALEMMPTCQPDVILMDLHMPRMNGIEAATLIRKTWKDTVIIGISGDQDAATVEAFLKAGAVAVIPKDRLDELHDPIRRACSKQAQNGNSTSTMYIKHVQVEQGVLNAVVVGPFELTLAQHQFMELLDKAVHSGATKVLIDGRQVTGYPSAFERFLYGTFVACASLEVLNRENAKLRFAYVIYQPVHDPQRYGETVVVNGGMDVKAFEDMNEAVEWLQEQKG